MKTLQTQDDNALNFSLEYFLGIGSFNKLFDGIKNSLHKEQKELVLGKKTRQETDGYFNFMEFLFSSPDKAV